MLSLLIITTVGRDWKPLAALGIWDQERGTPVSALRVQCIVSLLLVLAGAWTGSGFKLLVEFTAPVLWLFFLLAGVSLFVSSLWYVYNQSLSGWNAAWIGVPCSLRARLCCCACGAAVRLNSVNRDLRPQLWKQLKVGTRVVSHAFDMGQEWPPEKNRPCGRQHHLLLDHQRSQQTRRRGHGGQPVPLSALSQQAGCRGLVPVCPFRFLRYADALPR